MAKEQLVIHGQKEFIDLLAESYILIEPYLEYTEIDTLISDRFRSLRHPYFNSSDALKVDEYITELSQRMIDSYGESISNYTGVDLNRTQWTTVLCVWFRSSLSDLFYRYKKLCMVDNRDVYTIGVRKYSPEKLLADSIRNSITSHSKNVFLWTFIAERIGIEIKKEISLAESQKEKHRNLWNRVNCLLKEPSKIEQYVKCRREKRNNSLAPGKINSASDILLYETLLPQEIEKSFCERACGKIGMIRSVDARRENERINLKYDFDYQTRKKYLKNAFKPQNQFENIAQEFMLKFLPIAYFEGAKEIYNRAVEITKTWNFRKIYSSYTSMELMDYCFALARIRGTEIYGIQHSGAYGGTYLGFRTEAVFSDVWCTWGWKCDTPKYIKSELRPMKMIRLPKYNCSSVKKKDKILWACNYPMLGDLGRGYCYGDYMNLEMEFLDNLDEDIRSRIVFRINEQNSFNKKFSEKVKLKYPSVRIENRGEISFSDSVRESRFVICDYHGSPDLEALLLGIPIVLFLAAGITVLNPVYKKQIERMKILEIFAESPKDMAEILNKHKEDRNWLYSNEIQECYDSYLKEFTGLDHALDSQTLGGVYDTWYKEFIS